MNAYTYKTEDFGLTWENIIPNNDVHGFARSIQEDYINPNLLFLGTEFGLYISINGGDTWNKFENNVPPVATKSSTITILIILTLFILKN